MKNKMKLFAAGLIAYGLLSSAFGSFGAGQTSPGSYSTTVSVPSTGYVHQSAAAYYGDHVQDSGPLGNYFRFPGNTFLDIYGYVPAGNYNVFLEVAPATSGYAAISISW